MFTQLGADLARQSKFNDTRLSTRLGIIVEQIGNNFGSSIPQCGGNHGQTQAIYRFMSNDKVDTQRLCESEAKRVVDKVSSSKGQTYLAISDTTVLNYSYSKSREHLDSIGQADQKGYFCHNLGLIDASGCPMGLVNQRFYNRPVEAVGNSRKEKSTLRKRKPVEEKESNRWLEDYQLLEEKFSDMPQHRIVHVMDAEGDMFEHFALRQHEHIHFLSRVRFDRSLVGTQEKLKSEVSKSDCLGCMKIHIRDDKTHQNRVAHLEIRFSKMTLQPPPCVNRLSKRQELSTHRRLCHRS
jgi:hypothetical protein